MSRSISCIIGVIAFCFGLLIGYITKDYCKPFQDETIHVKPLLEKIESKIVETLKNSETHKSDGKKTWFSK